jgi:hypothetical protein
MEPSPSSEANSRLPTQEFTNILRKPNVHYFVFKNPPLVALPKPDESPSSISLRSISVLSSHLLLDHFSCSFLLALPPTPRCGVQPVQVSSSDLVLARSEC